MTAIPSGQSTALANILCMLSMLLWAAGLPAADILIGPVPPLPLAAARITMAAAVLLPIWWLVEGTATLRRAAWLRGIMVGGLSIGLGAFLMVLGQGMTNSVTVAVIAATMPVIGIAIEVALDGRRLKAGLVIGVILSLTGGVMALGDADGGVGLGLGALMCLTSVIVFTMGSRMTVTSFPEMTPLGRTTITLIGASVATCLAAGVNAALGGAAPDWAVLGWQHLGALAIFAICGMAISQLLWILAVGQIGIALSAIHINATPFYVMIILFLMGGTWNWMQAIAAAIVGLGVLIAQGLIPIRGKRRENTATIAD
jgi:drug/metabolite transporter (DMT)-like permease